MSSFGVITTPSDLLAIILALGLAQPSRLWYGIMHKVTMRMKYEVTRLVSGECVRASCGQHH